MTSDTTNEMSTPRTDAFLDGEGDPSRIIDFARHLEREVQLLEQGVITCPGGMEIIEELREMRRKFEEGK